MYNDIIFRSICDNDYIDLCEIYNYYVLNTTITFWIKERTLNQIKEIFSKQKPDFDYYILEKDGNVIGYCGLIQYNKKDGYNRTKEISIMIKQGYTNHSIGTKAVKFLLEIAIKRGIKVLFAGICAENNPSIALFKKCGFSQCAHLKQVGEKFGRILDVLNFQKLL